MPFKYLLFTLRACRKYELQEKNKDYEEKPAMVIEYLKWLNI